jgi:glycerol kinase
MNYVLALDQGTTSSRAIIFDQHGRAVATAQKEFEQIYPQPGWVEHAPDDIWSTQLHVASEAIAKARLSARDIAAIGITNQRETTVVWERRSGRPIHNAIVWQDRRTTDFCNRLKADGYEPAINKKTGLLLDPYFSASKIRWLLDHVADARKNAEAGELAFGTVDTWLLYNLTEGRVHVTDASNASRTLLYDIHENRWDDELLTLFDIPASMLPEVKASSECYAETAAGLFSASIPVAGIAGDQQAALFGQQCIEPGMLKTTYGTGCFMLLNTGAEAVTSRNRLLTTIAWRIGGQTTYALEGSVFIGGAVVQWLRDELKLIDSASEIEALAATVEDNGGVYFVPAFTGLGAPHWDPHARGLIAGLTRGSNRGHFARAALESVAYQVADVLTAMTADAGLTIAEIRVDGGAAANNLLMQFQTDIIGVPIIRPHVLETTALGAAYLAGLAVGYWPNREAVSAQWEAERTFRPEMVPKRAAALREAWAEAVKRARH